MEAQRGLLSAAVDATPDAFITTDREGTITSWNAGAARLYGADVEQSIGASILHDDRARRWLKRVLDGEEITESAVPRRRRDGSEIWVSASAGPLRENGVITGMALVVREVTDQQRLVARLEATEERQRLLLASLPGTVVALYDRDLKCQMLDGQMVRQAGIDPARYVGRPIRETLPPGDLEGLEPLIMRALDGESSATEWTSAISGITYQLDVVPYRLTNGTVAGAFAVGRDLSEHIHRNGELREREQQLAHAQAVAHLGSWELDVAGDRLTWSDELCRIAGQPLGSTPTVAEFLSMIHPEDRHLLAGEVQEAITGQGSRSEYRIVRPDGTIRHVLTTRDPRKDADGNVVRLFGTTQDITDRVEAERRLRQLAAVVRHTGEAITARDVHGNITEWNHGAQRLFGYSEQEMMGQPLARLIPPERAGEEAELLGRALAGETIEQFQTERLRCDGTRLEVSITVSPVRDHQGKPAGASIITRDVTANRRADRSRKQAIAKMAEAQRLARIGSWSWDTTEDQASWSAEMYRLFGRDPILGPATGEQFFAYLHPDDHQRVTTSYLDVFGGGGQFEIDYRINAGDGADRVLHAYGRLERPGYYVGTVQDVTQLRLAEREARESAELFRQTLEHAPIGIALVSPGGRWLSANLALCEIVGYSEEELLALSFQDITHPDDLDADLELRDQVLTGRTSGYRLGKRYFHKSGRIVHAQLYVSLVRDEHGHPVHFISQIQDVTAQHRAHQALVDSERRIQSIAAGVPGMVYRFTLSPTGEAAVPFASDGCREVYGIEASELMADPALVLDAIHPDDREAWEASVAHSAATLERWEWRSRHVLPNGMDRYLHAVAQPFREEDGTVVWDGVISDETAARTAQLHEAEIKHQLDQALEQFQVAFERAPIGMVIIGLDGMFQRVNESLCEMTGYTPQQFRALPPFAIVDPEDRKRIQAEFAKLGRETDVLSLEHRIVHADDHPVWIQSRVTLIRDERGQAVHALAQVLDLTERRAYEQRLKQLADHDSLTGLLNRRGFEAALDAHLARCRRYGSMGVLLALDLDGFKMVNDTLGHGAGDELIVSCAHALRHRLRETDTIARLGGDEFAVMLSDQGLEEAQVVARALVDTIRECTAGLPASYPGRVTVSIGVSAFPNPVCSADEMMTRSDRALYEAKQSGRDRYALYQGGSDAAPRATASAG